MFSKCKKGVRVINVARGGIIEARQGNLFGNEIGVHIGDTDYDLELLYDEVFIFGNRTNVAQRTLPLPEPSNIPSN